MNILDLDDVNSLTGIQESLAEAQSFSPNNKKDLINSIAYCTNRLKRKSYHYYGIVKFYKLDLFKSLYIKYLKRLLREIEKK